MTPDSNETGDTNGQDRQATIDAYNARTRKLVPTGDAHRDRIVAARLNLRREGER